MHTEISYLKKKSYKTIYSSSKNALDYFLFYFLFFFPVTNFTVFRREIFYFQFLIAVFLVLKKDYRYFFDITYLKVMLMISIVIVIQSTLFERGKIDSIIGQYMFFSYPYFMVIIFHRKIPKYFINVVVTISIISFIFFFPTLVSKSIHGIISNFGKFLNLDVYHFWKTSFIIYTVEPISTTIGLARNAGNFKEPGYFSCYLALALVWNIIFVRKIKDKKNYIIILALITTFSTSGYIALYFVIIYWAYNINKVKDIRKVILIFSTIVIIVITFINLRFMSNKLFTHYERQKYTDTRIWGRFGSVFKNFEEISQYPLTGRGFLPQTRFDELEDYGGELGKGLWQNINSWTGLMVRLGIPMFLLFLYWYVSAIKKFYLVNKLNKDTFLLLLGTIIIVLSSQSILVTPAFLSFLYFNKIKSDIKERKPHKLNTNKVIYSLK